MSILWAIYWYHRSRWRSLQKIYIDTGIYVKARIASLYFCYYSVFSLILPIFSVLSTVATAALMHVGSVQNGTSRRFITSLYCNGIYYSQLMHACRHVPSPSTKEEVALKENLCYGPVAPPPLLLPLLPLRLCQSIMKLETWVSEVMNVHLSRLSTCVYTSCSLEFPPSPTCLHIPHASQLLLTSHKLGYSWPKWTPLRISHCYFG